MTATAELGQDPTPHFADSLDYVTVRIGEQLLGLPIERVRDVFIADRITVVPGAPPDIVGLLNLRGRIVTAICLRNRLGRANSETPDRSCGELTAIGLDHHGEAYGLIVDAVGEVLRLDRSTFEPLPVNLDPTWAVLAAGVHRLPGSLLVILDLDAVLDLDLRAAA
jgi:purine-binding chemotaxis protein CheW